MKIAVCGTRGIPACYGGFETFAEELSTRLVKRGHEVVVYGRSHVIDWSEPEYCGVKIRLLPAPKHKYLETPIHSLRSFIDLLRAPVDVVLLCNAANSPFAWIPRLRGMPVAINVDGIERKRAKWNSVGKLWYRLGEICSVLFASRVIADADVIADYYQSTYRRSSAVIRYGCTLLKDGEILESKFRKGGEIPAKFSENELFKELEVSFGNYILYVSRLEPENNAHVVIQAFNLLPDEVRKARPLIIVGDAPYADAYISSLREMACPEVRFAGYRFGAAYHTLQTGAWVYVQATEVGGTHPALVEAMGYANCVLANDTPENAEVVSTSGLLYRKNDSAHLSGLLSELSSDAERVCNLREQAHARAKVEFDWEVIVNDYERLLASLC